MGWIILIVIIVIVGMSEYFSDKTGSASSRKKLANGLNRKLIMEKQKDLLVR